MSLWPKVKLGDVCEIRAGADYKAIARPDGKYPVYGTGGIIARTDQWRCPANTVIVGRKGTLDRPMLITEPFWNIDTCFGLIPGEGLDPAYLYRFCQNFDFYSLIPASGRPSTTASAIKAIEIPLPPLSIQREIVARVERGLAAADSVAGLARRCAAEAALWRKAILKEAFQ